MMSSVARLRQRDLELYVITQPQGYTRGNYPIDVSYEPIDAGGGGELWGRCARAGGVKTYLFQHHTIRFNLVADFFSL